ncbi:MAG: hypothetical protein BroJett033_8010 [Chloroflexota bacterium]|nr:MAG: hypothetical protein BroJett033_8010 [Chloroflexota bacterium]
MLEAIGERLAAAGLVGASWAAEMSAQGALVRLYRDYHEGQHRLKLTSEMRKMMQIADTRLDRYNANYCEMVVAAMADRLTLEGVETDTPEGRSWAEQVFAANRLDGLQIEVREAVLRDGVTYVMVAYDDVRGVTLAHEQAWDNSTGCMVVYDRSGRDIVAGVKVWLEADLKRVNIYYPASIEKFEVRTDGLLRQMGEADDTSRDGAVPGVPLVAFRNKGRGVSELVNVIPLQDSLNRTLISMIMSAELTAFAILFAKGFKPPAGLTPGMLIHAMIEDGAGQPATPSSEEEARAFATLINSYSLERIEGGSLDQLIGQAEFVIQQIATISNTPVPGQMGGDSQSGEALKQRDSRLLGKVQRAQVQQGNAWEDVLRLAHWQQELFGLQRPPAVTTWRARWKSAETRNDADILKAAELLQRWGFEREALRLMSQSRLTEYSEADIERMMAERAADGAAALSRVAGALPGMEDFVL